MPVRVLVVGDPHFREGSVREMELFIEQTVQIVQEQLCEIDFVVVLGDVMDRHGILHQRPFHQACRFLLELAKHCPTYCLIGNHDFDIPSRYLPENHPFKVMTWSSIPNLTIVDTPRIVMDTVFMTPYVPPGMFAQAVTDALQDTSSSPWWKKLHDRGVSMAFAHQEFRGCQIGRLRSDVGDEWAEDAPFGSVPFVVSGHIHDHQMLGQNIMYLGTPMQVNFGEQPKRGIALVHLDPGIQWNVQWFPIRVPLKITKHVPVDQLDRWLLQRAEDMHARYGLAIPKMISKNVLQHIFTMPFDELKHRVSDDRFLDQVRLQIQFSDKLPAAALRNLMIRIPELPLGVTRVFFHDTKPFSSGKTNSAVEKEERYWLHVLVQKLESSKDPACLHLLNSVLHHLSN